MSYFIANKISIDKKSQTFKVKGGDNNVVPRSNYWSNNIPLIDLYGCINSGDIKLLPNNELSCLINYLVKNNDFGGDWDNKDDYFHLQHLPKTAQEMDEAINQLKELAEKSTYYKDELTAKEKIKNNFDFYRKKLNDFNNNFLELLNNELNNLSNKADYILYFPKIERYIYKLGREATNYKRGSLSLLTNYKSEALKLTKYRAIYKASIFDGCEVLKLDN